MGCREAIFVDKSTFDFPIFLLFFNAKFPIFPIFSILSFFSNHAAGHPGKCLVLYATRQLIWGQTPKFCIKVYWNKSILLLLYSTAKTKRNMCRYITATRMATEITQTGCSTKTSSDWSIDLCVLRDACNQLFYVFLLGSLCVRGAGRRGNKITNSSIKVINNTGNPRPGNQ